MFSFKNASIKSAKSVSSSNAFAKCAFILDDYISTKLFRTTWLSLIVMLLIK